MSWWFLIKFFGGFLVFVCLLELIARFFERRKGVSKMGQNAEDMVDGQTCSDCGTFFEVAHGFPVLCSDCHREDKGKSGLPKATEKEL